MRQHRKNHFLTLVLTALLGILYSPYSYSLPDSAQTPKTISTSPVLKKKEIEKTTPDIQDSLSITPTEAPPPELGEDPLLPSRRLAKYASTLGTGLWVGSLSRFESTEGVLLFSTGVSHYEEAQFAKEWSFEFTSNSMFGFSYGYKWLQNLRQYYEPFYKVSLGGLFMPSENFGTFINWKRYQIRGSIGLDD